MSSPVKTPLPAQVKALLSGVIAGLGSLTVALTDNQVTLAEGSAALLAAVVAYGAVFGVRNR